MARDIVGVSVAAAPPTGREQRWTGNREPELAEMLEDRALQAVMARDGVTRQAVERLVDAFHRARRVGHSGTFPADPPGIYGRSPQRESDSALSMTRATTG